MSTGRSSATIARVRLSCSASSIRKGSSTNTRCSPKTSAGTAVFESEALENIPVGWKARETYEVISPDEFVETFELASGAGVYEVYSTNRFKRVRVP
jgi:hypothetical protein